jgi:hypothetical protein
MTTPIKYGKSIYESTDTEVLVVRRANDSGDVFNVNTTNSQVEFGDNTFYTKILGGNPVLNFDTNDYISFNRSTNLYDFVIGGTSVASLDSSKFSLKTASLDLPGDKTGTPSTVGEYISISTVTFTDNDTAGSGTATAMAFNAFAAPTLSASNSSVSTTTAATLYIAGAPISGTNETITNAYSIWVDSGNMRLDGSLDLTGDITNSSDLKIDSTGGILTLDGDSSIAVNSTGNIDINTTGGVLNLATANSGVAITIGNAVSEVIISDNLTVEGDLIVNGSTTTVNGTTFLVADNLILVNAGPSSTADGGMLVKRYQTINNASAGGDIILDTPKETSAGHGGVSGTSSVSQIVLNAGANSSNDFYNGWWVKITSGMANGNVRKIKDYVGGSKTALIFTSSDETASPQTPPTGSDFTSEPTAVSYELFDCGYAGMFYDESANEWAVGCTSNDPGSNAVVINNYIDFHVKNLTTEGSTVSTGATFNGLVLIDDTNSEALLVRKNGDSGDVFTVNTTSSIVTVNGTIVIDGTSTEQFLVRKAGDTGDVFSIDTTNSIVDVTGSITISGNVDGRDISVDGANLDNLYTTIGLSSLTSVEVDQLENIGTTTINSTQWGYIGSTDQGLSTLDSVQFNSAILDSTGTEAFLVRKNADAGDVFAVDTTNSIIGVTGSITVTGNVDGRDISVDGGNLDNLYTTIGLSALTSGEVDQLENIGTTTINSTQWGYIGSTDQGLATVDAVQFNSAIIDSTETEAFLVRKNADAGDVFTVDTTNSRVLVNGIVVEPTSGDITNTSFAGGNNQVSASNVTGLLFSEASVKSFRIIATVIVDATADLYEQIEIRGLQKVSGTWVIADIRLGDDTDVEFTILSTGGNGQIQYTSSNYTGFASLNITFRAWVN